MPDMIVPLYKLPPIAVPEGIAIRRPAAYEITQVRSFVTTNFQTSWADEISVCFRQPVTAYIALRTERIVGFAAYDATRRNFFGPTGVLPSERGKGVGKALLLSCLHAMSSDGFAYGIIGGVGPAQFYAKTVGAHLIPDSTPGIYADRLIQ